MPAHLAAMKWPASCTKTSTPSTTIREMTVISTTTSRSHVVARTEARPLVGLAHDRHAGGGTRNMIVEHALDDLADAAEGRLAREECGDGDLVGRVEHCRRNPPRPAGRDARGQGPEDIRPHRLESKGAGRHGVESAHALVGQ